MNKKAIPGIIIFVIIIGIYFGLIQKEAPTLNLVKVAKGNIVQEVSETGQVKKGEEIKLSFKNSGRIEKIYVEVGEKVKAGDVLAKLETADLTIQLQKAKASLGISQAKLDKLLAGASPEEIQKAKTVVANAKTALQNANQNLQDLQAQAAENLSAADEDALNALEDASLKAENAQNLVDLIQRTYFTVNDQEGLKVKESKEKIIEATSQIKSFSKENIESSLSQTKEKLSEISEALKVIRETCQSPSYLGLVSATDKSSLDTHRGYINTALTNVVNSYQTITSTKLADETSLNVARAQVSRAEGAIIAAEDDLALITASPRQEDIDLYQAQVRQAEAQVQLLENQIEETILRSPISGQITKVIKRIGETVQPMMKDVVISLIPEEPFQIEVDIPEVEIGKIDLRDPSKITLDAFPEEEFSGKVIEIEPAETIISGVVYYKIKIGLDTENTKIKPGMTANVTIITDFKENVLILPQRAVLERNGKKFVRVPEDSTFKEIEVQTGLRGSGGEIEIISGLKEGDKVITFIKSD